MGTYLALWKTDGLYQLLDGVELQGSQAQLAGNLIYHLLILRRTGGSVFLKILVGIALKLLDDATGNQLHITLGRSEVDKRTTVYQWRTCYAHVALLQANYIIYENSLLGSLRKLKETIETTMYNQT